VGKKKEEKKEEKKRNKKRKNRKEKKKPKKKRTIEVKKIAEEWKIWNKEGSRRMRDLE